jgi:hypothetical protein
MTKFDSTMQGDGGGIGAVPDHRNHLTAFRLHASPDKSREQQIAYAVAGVAMIDIDRILDRVSVGGPGWRSVAEADDLTAYFGDDIREAPPQNIGAAAGQLISGRGLLLEGGETMKHVEDIDALNSWDLRFARIPNRAVDLRGRMQRAWAEPLLGFVARIHFPLQVTRPLREVVSAISMYARDFAARERASG